MVYSGILVAHVGSGASDRSRGQEAWLWQSKETGLDSLATQKLLRMFVLGVGESGIYKLQSLFC